MKKIIVLQGPPASGKTTYAKKLHKENKNNVIVSRDNIRLSRGDYWIPEQEDWISDIEEFEVKSALKHNLTPIIDATNLNQVYIDKWKAIADNEGAELEIIPMDVPPIEEAIKRDCNRERFVGANVIFNFYKKYYPHLLSNLPNITDIFFNDKQQIKQTIIDLINNHGELNKYGQKCLYWPEKNIYIFLWVDKILMYSDDQTFEITKGLLSDYSIEDLKSFINKYQ